MRFLGTRILCGRVALALFSALVIFAAHPAQAQSESVLYDFCSQPNCADGQLPRSHLTADGAGNFYGTASGGANGGGVVFELSPNGGGSYNETAIYSFCAKPACVDGSNTAYAGVIIDGAGNLYGTTFLGGANNYGVVFELSLSGGVWTETVLYSFGTNLPDAISPAGDLVMDGAGNLFGETSGSVGGIGGTVYELSPNGASGWTEQVIYDNACIHYPSGLAVRGGNLFGFGCQNMFELSPNGSGWTPSVIFTFSNPAKQGSEAYGDPVFDSAGNMYGATYQGGAKNVGVVWKLSPRKKGWKEKVLYSFKGKKDGALPGVGVVLDSSLNIYGTTSSGGTHGGGIVFELMAVGSKYTEKVLWNFNNTDGNLPYDNPILVDGSLYGTTVQGGTHASGVVFDLTP